MTTHEAAALLNVSSSFVIKEIEARRLHCHMVNTHRCIDFDEVMRYQKEQRGRSESALRRMHEVDEQLGEKP